MDYEQLKKIIKVLEVRKIFLHFEVISARESILNGDREDSKCYDFYDLPVHVMDDILEATNLPNLKSGE